MDKELRFRTTKNRFSNSLNSIKKETKLRELRKITTKGINNRDRLETEVKEKEELQMQGESEATKLLADLNIEDGIQVDELLEIETNLQRLKIPKKQYNLKINYLRETSVSHVMT